MLERSERRNTALLTDKIKTLLKEYMWLTIGTMLTVIGVYFFKFPNNFSTGGVSGFAVIMGHYFPEITPGSFMMVINILLLLLGFAVLGKEFGGKTAYVSLLMSFATWLLEIVVPMKAPMTALADPTQAQPLVELIFAVAFPALGSAILFNMDASSGGTDIVAMILRKYTSLDIGKALLCSDLTITLMAFVAFGPVTGLFSILGLAIKSLMVDMVLENIKVAFQTRMHYSVADGVLRTPKFAQEERGIDLRARDLLSVFDMEDVADVRADSLPYGQQRKLEICRALASNPKVLLLD